ncbi:MAG: hypothetical protein U9R57_04645 [Thermodesulfobacteriota bacterium]|nr:hypothetical protein [Thermodesulfobacteriota bacterium]
MLTEKLKWDFLEPVEWKGAPTSEDIELATAQSKELARQIKAENKT